MRPAAGAARLGWLGALPVVIALALLLQVAPALATDLARGLIESLVWYGLALLGALLLARHVLHVALLARARELGHGGVVRCPHCGHEVPDVPFCPHCGLAMRSIAKRARTARAEPAGGGGMTVMMGSPTASRAGSRLGASSPCWPPRSACSPAASTSSRAGRFPVAWAARCPPPSRSAAAAHVFKATIRELRVFDPWQIDSQDARGAVVFAGTQYGDLTVQLTSTDVGAGTSAQALLSRAVSSLDTSKLSGLRDEGPIYGASVGYVAGAGESYSAVSDQPNAPSVPVFIEIMASVQGGTGIIFLASSTLNPDQPDPGDPRQVPGGEYDRMVNSVTWL